MAVFKDLTGNRYGRLTVVKPQGRNKYGKSLFLCKCDCGKEILTLGNSLQCGRTKSCGCFRIEKSLDKVNALAKHNKSNTRLFNIWHSMKQRCYYTEHKSYEDYGGRGIAVCEEWQEFEPFYKWAIENGYADNLTIDRKDVNGNYEPSNCRWATPKEQQNNKRNNKIYEYKGEKHNLSEWASITGIDRDVLEKRLKNNWSVEKALSTPKRKKQRCE